ncbi:MAG: hypothetical protein KDB53_00735, partial [Planctomycetes bacterium]|nr:hypothetical protein [Planctomycetota bacterium]
MTDDAIHPDDEEFRGRFAPQSSRRIGLALASALGLALIGLRLFSFTPPPEAFDGLSSPSALRECLRQIIASSRREEEPWIFIGDSVLRAGVLRAHGDPDPENHTLVAAVRRRTDQPVYDLGFEGLVVRDAKAMLDALHDLAQPEEMGRALTWLQLTPRYASPFIADDQTSRPIFDALSDQEAWSSLDSARRRLGLSDAQLWWQFQIRQRIPPDLVPRDSPTEPDLLRARVRPHFMGTPSHERLRIYDDVGPASRVQSHIGEFLVSYATPLNAAFLDPADGARAFEAPWSQFEDPFNPAWNFVTTWPDDGRFGPEHFLDHCHLSAAGNELLAERLIRITKSRDDLAVAGDYLSASAIASNFHLGRWTPFTEGRWSEVGALPSLLPEGANSSTAGAPIVSLASDRLLLGGTKTEIWQTHPVVTQLVQHDLPCAAACRSAAAGEAWVLDEAGIIWRLATEGAMTRYADMGSPLVAEAIRQLEEHEGQLILREESDAARSSRLRVFDLASRTTIMDVATPESLRGRAISMAKPWAYFSSEQGVERLPLDRIFDPSTKPERVVEAAANGSPTAEFHELPEQDKLYRKSERALVRRRLSGQPVALPSPVAAFANSTGSHLLVVCQECTGDRPWSLWRVTADGRLAYRLSPLDAQGLPSLNIPSGDLAWQQDTERLYLREASGRVLVIDTQRLQRFDWSYGIPPDPSGMATTPHGMTAGVRRHGELRVGVFGSSVASASYAGDYNPENTERPDKPPLISTISLARGIERGLQERLARSPGSVLGLDLSLPHASLLDQLTLFELREPDDMDAAVFVLDGVSFDFSEEATDQDRLATMWPRRMLAE